MNAHWGGSIRNRVTRPARGRTKWGAIHACFRNRRSFTLTELLVVIMVIAILSSSMMFALYNAAEQAREARTQAQIVHLHELLMTRWESYRTRAIRLNLDGTARRHAPTVARARLLGLRDLMRMELPERKTDILDGSVIISFTFSYTLANSAGDPQVFDGTVNSSIAPPSVWREYRRRVANLVSPPNFANGMNQWTEQYQGAECLYLIVASMQDITGNALDFFRETEIGDVDGDGMPEILDAWGNPIEFLRWAPGYAEIQSPDGSWGVPSPGLDDRWGVAGVDDDGNGTVDDITEALWPGSDDVAVVSNFQNRDLEGSPDPFDPLRVFPQSFALYPLIYSAGPDGIYDILSRIPDNTASPPIPDVIRYADPKSPYYPNNPYYVDPDPDDPKKFAPGTPMDASGDGRLSFMDNIVNHALGD